MNWLAHLFLAEPTPEGRLGNLLGDLVKGKQRLTLSEELQVGIECHQIIDSYTDHHPLVKHSKSLVGAEYRRFSGIIIDVYYDYILASNWDCYATTPLPAFSQGIYNSWSNYLTSLPQPAQAIIRRLIDEDWLTSYQTLTGIENTLRRISWRLSQRGKRNYDLTPAIAILVNNEIALAQDFQEFFPRLQSHIEQWHSNRLT